MTKVVYAPVIDPSLDRRVLTAAPGQTIAEIVATAAPLARADSLRVTLVDARGTVVVPAENWLRVRPKPGVTVVVRPVPGNNVLRSVLQIVITVAAVALGQAWAVPLASAIGIPVAAAAALITIGVSVIGSLLLNALIPPPKRDPKDSPTYAITGFRNTSNPDGAIPVPFGRIRMAPPFAAPPYTEIVGDVQYIRALFLWGYGPLHISDLKIGDTSISEYDEVQIETREGWPSDAPVTLYPDQVIEEGIGAELTRDWQRTDSGDYVQGGSTVEKPIVRYTASDADRAGVIIGFPGGLTTISSSGNRQNRTVSVRIRQRPIAGGDWQTVTTLDITAARQVPIWRQHIWTLPTRGAWQIEVTRMTDESKDSNVTDRTVWQALQSYRPEYPIAFDKSVALTSVRIKATAQLNGQLDNLSGLVNRVAADWDAATNSWIVRETRSPAAAYRWALQGPASTYPATDAELYLDPIQDWAVFCKDKGLHYDRVHDQTEPLQDALQAICHAGRASWDRSSGRYSVVVDRPSDLIVDHINPRNARDFRVVRTYPERPHAFRVPFADASNDYKKSERLVPWPGHTGPIEVTEQLELPGITDPAAIWIEARRRQYEIDLRPDQFQATQDGLIRHVTRGDQVALAYDVLDRLQMAARVVRTDSGLVEVDEPVTFVAGTDYAIRWRVLSAEDTIGTSIVRTLHRDEGTTHLLRLIDRSTLPLPGDIVEFGPAGQESQLARLRKIERGQAGAQILHMVAASPEIDELTNAEVAPAWDGRVGSMISGDGSTPAPAVPLFISVLSGLRGTGTANGLQVVLRPGDASVTVASYRIDHRLAGTTPWTSITITAASSGAAITGYTKGDAVEMRAVARNIYGQASAPTAIVTETIGSADPVIADVTALTVTIVSASARRYAVTFGPGEQAGYQIRARKGTGWTWDDLSPLHSGTLTVSPWDTSVPTTTGAHVFGAVAVTADGLTSETPFLVAVTL